MVLKLMMKNYEVLDFSVKGNNIKNIDKIISMERIIQKNILIIQKKILKSGSENVPSRTKGKILIFCIKGNSEKIIGIYY